MGSPHRVSEALRILLAQFASPLVLVLILAAVVSRRWASAPRQR